METIEEKEDFLQRVKLALPESRRDLTETFWRTIYVSVGFFTVENTVEYLLALRPEHPNP